MKENGPKQPVADTLYMNKNEQKCCNECFVATSRLMTRRDSLAPGILTHMPLQIHHKPSISPTPPCPHRSDARLILETLVERLGGPAIIHRKEHRPSSRRRVQNGRVLPTWMYIQRSSKKTVDQISTTESRLSKQNAHSFTCCFARPSQSFRS